MRYAVAVLAALVATGVVNVHPSFADRGAFLFYIAAVALVTWFAGWGPGLLTVVLSTTISICYIVPTFNAPIVDSMGDALRLVLFLATSLVMIGLHASRERASSDARSSEQRLAFALDSAGMGAWRMHLKTDELWCSEGMGRILGYSLGKCPATYQEMVAHVHPDDQESLRSVIAKSKVSLADFEIHCRLAFPDAKMRWLSIRGRVINDNAGHPEHLVGIGADITDRMLREIARTTPSATQPTA